MTTQKRSSFYWPMQCMGSSKRAAMKALYAFCREIDDVADSSEPASFKRDKLDRWHHEIEQLFADMPTHALSHALANTPLCAPANKAYFLGIIDGVRMDVEGEMLRPSLEQLLRYCYGVAGCVGMLALTVMGVDQQRFGPFALALGNALQLTNILRDVDVDAEMGRIYLPHEWLAQGGIPSVTPQQMVEQQVDLSPVLLKLKQHALYYYKQTEQHPMSAQERWRLLPALLMRDVYKRLWHKLSPTKRSHPRAYRLGRLDKVILLSSLAGYGIRCLPLGGSVR